MNRHFMEWREGTLAHSWWECKLVQPLWKTVWRFLKKLKIELPYDPAIALLGIYLKETKTLIQKDTCTPMFMAALFAIAKIWKQPKCPSTDEWIKKWYIYIYIYTMEYLSTIKKNKQKGASLVAQWLRIYLPMQGTRVRALVWEDPTCRGATRPVSHNYWACASGACALQQVRPR